MVLCGFFYCSQQCRKQGFPLLLLLLLYQSTVAQDVCDTLELSPAEITAQRLKKVMAGTLVVSDSSLPAVSVAPSIAEALRLLTPLLIRVYGEGGIASLSYRGSSAQHSGLNWNGIELNSSFLGMADLNMTVLGKGDVLYLGQEPTSSTLPGASLKIRSHLPDSGKREAGLEFSLGSYSAIRASVSAALGGPKLSYRVQPYIHTSANDYHYLAHNRNGDDSLGRRNSASFGYYGLQQHFAIKLKGTRRILLHSYYTHSDRQLPEPVGGEALAKDQRLKETQGAHVLSAEGSTPSSEWQAQVGIHHQNYIYSLLDASPTITKAHTGHFSAGISQSGSQRLKSETNLNARLETVTSDNYATTHRRPTLFLTEQLRFLVFGRMAAGPAVKLMLREGRADLIPSLELTHSSLDERFAYFLRAASALRQPTFNDLYWNPGGNPELGDERGIRSELGGRMKMIRGTFSLEPELSLFFHQIRHWIAWRPEGTSPYWSPENLGRVSSAGIEVRLRSEWVLPLHKLGVSFNYAYTRAGETANNEFFPGSQLTYTPAHVASGIVSYSRGKGNLFLIGNYQGKRYTRTDHSGWLPGFATCDVSANHSLARKFQVFFNIRNITNTNYHIIAWYPMPRRTLELGLRFNTSAYEK
jgi:iron complex outermembrane receptor protein